MNTAYASRVGGWLHVDRQQALPVPENMSGSYAVNNRLQLFRRTGCLRKSFVRLELGSTPSSKFERLVDQLPDRCSFN
jgi:hypothetical protein